MSAAPPKASSESHAMRTKISYPQDVAYLLRKKRSIRRELLTKGDLVEKRIAILGGSTTNEVQDILEVLLLNEGIKPLFYQSDYNRYYEEVMFDNARLREFCPDLVYIFTTNANVLQYPQVSSSDEEIDVLVSTTLARFTDLWDEIRAQYECPIIQNNFELPWYRELGNLDRYNARGRTNFINRLNTLFDLEADKRDGLHLNDINYLSAWFGLERWYDRTAWYSYKYAMNLEAIPLVVHSCVSIIKAIYGMTKKCLVVDLDNTLWGGVIGDDGLSGIRIGTESAEAEAHTEFQQYIKSLKERGIILAVCSKNDDRIAKEGISHPDNVLRLGDFSAFKANWEPKPENLRAIAEGLNIGIDSLVFVDDNPVERDIVSQMEPDVVVVPVGEEVESYVTRLDKAGLFEPISLSADDLGRSSYYAGNSKREEAQKRFKDYDSFLESLEMVAEIRAFDNNSIPRIAQLVNKTNQFNLTTKRYTQGEIESIAQSDEYIALYGRLKDKFGDNGIVSAVIGRLDGSELHLDCWVMSCRVLKRGLENALFNCLVERARAKGLEAIHGYYLPTKKNPMVRELYKSFGFECLSKSKDHDTTWHLCLQSATTPVKNMIRILSDG